MKALSIGQPWAWLIVHGHKDIENRDWKYPPKYRGPLLIHASKTFDTEGFVWVKENMKNIDIAHEILNKGKIPWHKGGFVGTCRLNDVVEMDDSPWFFGPLGFKLRMPKPIEFIPYKGQLGLFDVPDSVIRQIKKIA